MWGSEGAIVWGGKSVTIYTCAWLDVLEAMTNVCA